MSKIAWSPQDLVRATQLGGSKLDKAAEWMCSSLSSKDCSVGLDSVSTALQGCFRWGKFSVCVELFEKMKETGLEPDASCLEAVAESYLHLGQSRSIDSLLRDAISIGDGSLAQRIQGIVERGKPFSDHDVLEDLVQQNWVNEFASPNTVFQTLKPSLKKSVISLEPMLSVTLDEEEREFHQLLGESVDLDEMTTLVLESESMYSRSPSLFQCRELLRAILKKERYDLATQIGQFMVVRGFSNHMTCLPLLLETHCRTGNQVAAVESFSALFQNRLLMGKDREALKLAPFIQAFDSLPTALYVYSFLSAVAPENVLALNQIRKLHVASCELSWIIAFLEQYFQSRSCRYALFLLDMPPGIDIPSLEKFVIEKGHGFLVARDCYVINANKRNAVVEVQNAQENREQSPSLKGTSASDALMTQTNEEVLVAH